MEQSKSTKIVIFIAIIINFISLYYAYKWLKHDDKEYEPIIVFWGLIAQVIIQIYTFASEYIQKYIQKIKKDKLFHDFLGKPITMEVLENNFSDITKISILGLGNVGKSTLIESLCNISNKNQVTQGRWAYLKKFSRESITKTAILDASGQSTSQQNDIAILSNFLIILLDHNESSVKQDVNMGRISNHEDFLRLLLDKLNNAKDYYPHWVLFLMNKKDTRLTLSKTDKGFINEKLNVWVTKFSSSFPLAQITFDHYSNKEINDCSLLQTLIAENLQKHLQK